MKLKFKLILPLLMLLGLVYGQEKSISPATTKGSSILSGIVVYSSSQDNALFDDSKSRSQLLKFNSSFLGFVTNKFGMGIDLGVERLNVPSFTSTALQIGPKIGYYFDSGDNITPYINAGISYLYQKRNFEVDRDQATRVSGVIGVLFRKEHFALNVEGGFHRDDFRGDGIGSIFFIGIGASACLYHSPEN